MAGVRLSPDEAMAKWQTRTSAATQDTAAGIKRVTEAPGLKAAAKSQKWLAAVTAAEPKFKRNVAAVSLQEWQKAALEVGVPRIASGVQAKGYKFGNFAREFFPYLDQGVQRVQQMPDITIEDSINRVAAMMRHNHGFRRSGA